MKDSDTEEEFDPAKLKIAAAEFLDSHNLKKGDGVTKDHSQFKAPVVDTRVDAYKGEVAIRGDKTSLTHWVRASKEEYENSSWLPIRKDYFPVHSNESELKAKREAERNEKFKLELLAEDDDMLASTPVSR